MPNTIYNSVEEAHFSDKCEHDHYNIMIFSFSVPSITFTQYIHCIPWLNFNVLCNCLFI